MAAPSTDTIPAGSKIQALQFDVDGTFQTTCAGSAEVAVYLGTHDDDPELAYLMLEPGAEYPADLSLAFRSQPSHLQLTASCIDARGNALPVPSFSATLVFSYVDADMAPTVTFD